MNCRIPSHLEFLPSLDVLFKISGMPYLDNSDIENYIPNPISSKYFYLHYFEKMTLSSNKSYFSLFHVNLNSLDAHLDDLHATLDLLRSVHNRRQVAATCRGDALQRQIASCVLENFVKIFVAATSRTDSV